MCDYSLHNVKSRPAKVGDKLSTRDFGTGTRGFAASEDVNVAVCVLPGTELSFAGEVTCLPTGLLAWRRTVINHKTAIFRQINKERVAAHHDPLEFPDGQIVPLTFLCEVSKLPFFSCRPSQRLSSKLRPSSGLHSRADRSQPTRWPPCSQVVTVFSSSPLLRSNGQARPCLM